MKTLKQKYINNIIDKLSHLKSYIEIHNSINLNDINIFSEDFFCQLLNMVYGYNLTNLNAISENYPGIDLGDSGHRICVQVTSDRSRKKVEKTITTFKDNNYSDSYDRLLFLVLGDKTNFRKEFESGDLEFKTQRDIIDIPQIIRDIKSMDLCKIEEVNDFINKNLIIPTETTKKITTTTSDDLSFNDFLQDQFNRVYALCLTKLKAIGISDSIAQDIISCSTQNNPFPNHENVQYLIGGFGSGKSHALYLYTLYVHNEYEKGNCIQYPIFIEAKTLLDYNNIQAWAKEEKISFANSTLIVDGLDEIEYSKIEILIQEIDYFANLYPNFKAIVASREMSILAGKEIIAMPPLSLKEVNNLYCKINNIDSYNIEHHINPSNREQMLRMLSKPFFALIYAIHMSVNSFQLKNEMDLVSIFVNKSLQPYIKKHPAVYNDFAQIALLSIERNLGYVHKTELPSGLDCDQLLSSGFFITDRHNNYTFSLPIVAQWLGAYAIRNKLVKFDTLIKDRNTAIKWRYPLSILFSQITYEESLDFFKEIVIKQPSIAALIIRDGILNDTAQTIPPAQTCAKQLYECMGIWITGLGNNIVNLKDDGIHLNTLAVAVQNDTLAYSWADTYLNQDILCKNNLKPSFHFSSVSYRSIPAQATWPWIITFEYLSKQIEKSVEGRKWLLLGSPLEHEYLWKNGLKLTKKGSLSQTPIPLSKLDEYRRYLHGTPTIYNGINLSNYFTLLDSYSLNNIQDLTAPFPIGDKPLQSGWIWGSYSKSRMLERIKDTYYKAIKVYKVFVETFFASIKDQMNTYLLLPGDLIGIMEYDEEGNDYTSGPSMSWYISPLPSHEESTCHIDYGQKNIMDDHALIFEELKKKGQALRSEDESYIHYTIHGGRCFDSSPTPVMDIVYKWLKDDLKKSSWIK